MSRMVDIPAIASSPATSSRAARLSSIRLDLKSAEEASIAGLLHDVGKIVLSSVAPDIISSAVWQASALRPSSLLRDSGGGG